MTDPISLEEIHSAGALFIDNADLYTGDDRQPDTEERTNPAELCRQTNEIWTNGVTYFKEQVEHLNPRNVSGTHWITNVMKAYGAMWTRATLNLK